MAEKRIDAVTGTQTVGHEWDGIEELDTPMPRWWLWSLYATIVFAIGYMVLYPAWPLIDRATSGVWGWSSRAEFENEMKAESDHKRPIQLALSQIPIERLAQDGKLLNAAVQGGASAFKVSCTQCHGSGAAGGNGYANLNDDDWLWGGDLKTIQQTIEHGIRDPGDKQTRMSQMPAFGRDGILPVPQIDDVASYVRTLSRLERPSAASARGATLFATNCSACHGPAGTGNRSLGAPNLTDRIWLYGGDQETVVETITNARDGIMPAWGQRFDPVTIKMLAAYVHSLGGGEAFVPERSGAPQKREAKAEAGRTPAPVKQNDSR